MFLVLRPELNGGAGRREGLSWADHHVRVQVSPSLKTKSESWVVLRPSPSHAKLLSPLIHLYEAQNDEKLVWEGVSDTRCAVHQAAEIQSTSSKLLHKHLSSPPPSPRVHLSEEPLPCSRKHFIAMLIFSTTKSHYFIDLQKCRVVAAAS